MEESVVLDLPIFGNKIGIRKFQIDDFQGIRTWVNKKNCNSRFNGFKYI